MVCDSVTGRPLVCDRRTSHTKIVTMRGKRSTSKSGRTMGTATVTNDIIKIFSECGDPQEVRISSGYEVFLRLGGNTEQTERNGI